MPVRALASSGDSDRRFLRGTPVVLHMRMRRIALVNDGNHGPRNAGLGFYGQTPTLASTSDAQDSAALKARSSGPIPLLFA
jgi:hypothetical protein